MMPEHLKWRIKLSSLLTVNQYFILGHAVVVLHSRCIFEIKLSEKSRTDRQLYKLLVQNEYSYGGKYDF